MKTNYNYAVDLELRLPRTNGSHARAGTTSARPISRRGACVVRRVLSLSEPLETQTPDSRVTIFSAGRVTFVRPPVAASRPSRAVIRGPGPPLSALWSERTKRGGRPEDAASSRGGRSEGPGPAVSHDGRMPLLSSLPTEEVCWTRFRGRTVFFRSVFAHVRLGQVQTLVSRIEPNFKVKYAKK